MRPRTVAIVLVAVLLVAGAASGGYALNRDHQIEQQRLDLAQATKTTLKGDCPRTGTLLDGVAEGPSQIYRAQVPAARRPCAYWAETVQTAAAAKPADEVMTYLRYLRDDPPAGLADRARVAARKAFASKALMKSMTSELCRQRTELKTERIADLTPATKRAVPFLRACIPAEVGIDARSAWSDYRILRGMSPRPAHLDDLLPSVGRAWKEMLKATKAEREKITPYQSVSGLHGRTKLRIQYLGRDHFTALFIGGRTVRVDAGPCKSCARIRTHADGKRQCTDNTKARRNELTLPAGDYRLITLDRQGAWYSSYLQWKVKPGKEYWYCFW